jgi:hypothetical protein
MWAVIGKVAVAAGGVVVGLGVLCLMAVAIGLFVLASQAKPGDMP